MKTGALLRDIREQGKDPQFSVRPVLGVSMTIWSSCHVSTPPMLPTPHPNSKSQVWGKSLRSGFIMLERHALLGMNILQDDTLQYYQPKFPHAAIMAHGTNSYHFHNPNEPI